MIDEPFDHVVEPVKRGGWIWLILVFALMFYSDAQAWYWSTRLELNSLHPGYSYSSYGTHLDRQYYNRPWLVYFLLFACGLAIIFAAIKYTRTDLNAIWSRTQADHDPSAANAYAGRAALILWITLIATATTFFIDLRIGWPVQSLTAGFSLLMALLICHKPVRQGPNGLWEIGFRQTSRRAIAMGAFMAVPILLCRPLLSYPLTLWFPGFSPDLTHARQNAFSISTAASYLNSWVIWPILEQAAFCGCILIALNLRLTRPLLSAVLTGALFSLEYGSTLSAIPYNFAFGLVGALLAYRARSLWPAIAFYAASNLLGLIPLLPKKG